MVRNKSAARSVTARQTNTVVSVQDPSRSPPDPVLWSADQVIHWAVWVMKEFNIDEMEIGSIHIPGRDLCAFSQEEFLQKVPNGEILWSHLELLRKCESDARLPV